MKGIIRSIKVDKSYGFIKDGESKEYFFHRTDFNGHWQDLVDDVERKQSVPVTFNPEETEKGLRARDVKRTDFPNQYP